MDQDLAPTFQLVKDTATLNYFLNIQNNRFLYQLVQQGKEIMAGLEELKNAVAAERTVTESAIKLLDGLAAKIAALAPNQADIDALAADVKAQTDALAAAVAADSAAAE